MLVSLSKNPDAIISFQSENREDIKRFIKAHFFQDYAKFTLPVNRVPLSTIVQVENHSGALQKDCNRYCIRLDNLQVSYILPDTFVDIVVRDETHAQIFVDRVFVTDDLQSQIDAVLTKVIEGGYNYSFDGKAVKVHR